MEGRSRGSHRPARLIRPCGFLTWPLGTPHGNADLRAARRFDRRDLQPLVVHACERFRHSRCQPRKCHRRTLWLGPGQRGQCAAALVHLPGLPGRQGHRGDRRVQPDRAHGARPARSCNVLARPFPRARPSGPVRRGLGGVRLHRVPVARAQGGRPRRAHAHRRLPFAAAGGPRLVSLSNVDSRNRGRTRDRGPLADVGLLRRRGHGRSLCASARGRSEPSPPARHAQGSGQGRRGLRSGSARRARDLRVGAARAHRHRLFHRAGQGRPARVTAHAPGSTSCRPTPIHTSGQRRGSFPVSMAATSPRARSTSAG